MEYIAFLESAARALPVGLIVLFYVVVLWSIFDRMSTFNDTEELFHKNNVAYLLQRLGLSAAQVIALLAVIPDFDVSQPLTSSLWLLAEGAWVTIALIAARWFVDWLILPNRKNQDLLKEGNLSVGITEAGAYLGIGILLGGSLTGTADTVWLSIASTVVFYLLGLVVVLGVFWLYELMTPYKIRSLLAEGSTAAGVELAGVFVATSIAIKVGVAGDFAKWGESFIWFFVTAAVSVGVLAAVWVATLLLAKVVWRLPKGSLRASPSLTVAVFRAGSMVMASVVTAALLGVA